MRTQITDSGVKLWLSANDTHRWATRPHAAWPCSELSGKRLFAEFDRGGLVGEDGATHHGAYDLAYLRCIPNMTVAAPLRSSYLRDRAVPGATNDPS